eukprot:902012-Pelagomonas_calceolata.AAC.15
MSVWQPTLPQWGRKGHDKQRGNKFVHRYHEELCISSVALRVVHGSGNDVAPGKESVAPEAHLMQVSRSLDGRTPTSKRQCFCEPRVAGAGR